MKGLAFVKDPDGYWVELVSRGIKGRIQNECNFSQTMLRVKDPKKSLAFYQKLGMTLAEEKHFSSFSLYFLGAATSLSYEKEEGLERKDRFYPLLELTHNHGTEDDPDFHHFTGNEEDRKGFGHVGFLVDDVYKACEEIGKLGYGFKKVRQRDGLKRWHFDSGRRMVLLNIHTFYYTKVNYDVCSHYLYILYPAFLT